MKYFIKQVLIFSAILLTPLILYFLFDPFKVLYKNPDSTKAFVITNRDFFSTEVYLKNRNRINYTSFIFGSSRSLAYQPLTWQKYLGKDDIPFAFDAASESIYGIYKKIRLLDSLHARLSNVLIILCKDVSFANTWNSRGFLFIKHPALSGESMIDFQLEFIKAYFDPKFLFSYYMYRILNRYEPFMHGYILNYKTGYDTVTNGIRYGYIAKQNTKIPAEYLNNSAFTPRNGERTDTVKRINADQVYMLNEIKRILEKNRTNYKIVLSPLYEQMKYKKEDFLILKNLFGKNLYDFSGKNRLTDSVINYYSDASHYKPIVGDTIFSIIYKKALLTK